MVGGRLYYPYGQQRERASKNENSMNPSQGERFSIRKAPDDDRNFFDAYCIIILAVHIVTANGNPKQKSRRLGTRRNIYKMSQVICYRLPLYAIRSIRCNC